MASIIYPGTFDPLTNGHIDIALRAARLFDRVIVAVGQSQRKTPAIPLEKRLAIIEEVFSPYPNVEAAILDGLLVDFARKHRAQLILRGLRAVSDFDYEFQLAGMNRQLAPDIETVFLPASDGVSHISGTLVREIMNLGGDVSQFVPKQVLEYFKKNCSGIR